MFKSSKLKLTNHINCSIDIHNMFLKNSCLKVIIVNDKVSTIESPLKSLGNNCMKTQNRNISVEVSNSSVLFNDYHKSTEFFLTL